MLLQERIESDMRLAMKAKDKKVNLLKFICAEFSRRPNLNVLLTDNEVISIIKKYLKSIDETISVTGITTDEQKFEMEVLSEYIPRMVTKEELRQWISENLELPEVPQARMKLMRQIMSHFGQSADGNIVKEVLRSM